MACPSTSITLHSHVQQPLMAEAAGALLSVHPHPCMPGLAATVSKVGYVKV